MHGIRFSKRVPHRRGFTFIEVMLAAVISVMVLAAAATMVSAVSNAATQTSDNRSVKTRGRIAARRLSAYLRCARGIGVVSSNAIVVWERDSNEDDVVNLYEIGIVKFQAANERIVIRTLEPSVAGDSGPPVADADFKSESNMNSLATAETVNTAILGDHIDKCGFNGYPANTETRVINYSFQVNVNSQTKAFRDSVSPRASADYLFEADTFSDDGVAGTPKRRTEYSRWTGWADVRGDTVAYPN